MGERPQIPDNFEIDEPTTLGSAMQQHETKTEQSALLANVRGGYKMRGGGPTPGSEKVLPPLLASKEKVGGPMQMQARMIEQANADADGGPIPVARETIGGRRRKRRKTRRKTKRKRRRTTRKTKRKRRKTKRKRRKRRSRRKRGGMCGCEKK